jgi:hypothetical protein
VEDQKGGGLSQHSGLPGSHAELAQAHALERATHASVQGAHGPQVLSCSSAGQGFNLFQINQSVKVVHPGQALLPAFESSA